MIMIQVCIPPLSNSLPRGARELILPYLLPMCQVYSVNSVPGLYRRTPSPLMGEVR